jgi:hypothetical protein
LRYFLATQPGRAPTLRRKAESGRIELGAAALQIDPERISDGDVTFPPILLAFIP